MEKTRARVPPGDPATTDLLTMHESIAGMLATQGDWRRAYHHLRSALDLARDGSLRDALTSSYNRRYLDQRLRRLLAERGRVAVALVDLDLFKQVNDTYGHLVGDGVLRRVADLLGEGLPPGGFCARYGGEEFALVLPDVDRATAVAVAERARARVADHPWDRLRPGLTVTVSVGITHAARPSAPMVSTAADGQLWRADTLLYAAKRAGRNSVAYREHEIVHIVHP